MIETDLGTVAYDWLICAMGCRIAPEEITGLAEVMGKDVYTFYTLDGALAFQHALDNLHAGKLVIAMADMPIKSPLAPLEFAFLADHYFRQKGVREQMDIHYVTPFSGAFNQPNANRFLSGITQEKNITVIPNFNIESIDANKKTLYSLKGDSVDYDMLCITPPNVGPQVIELSGLGDGMGYGLPVVDGNHKLIGVLTEADFLTAIHVKGDSAVKQMFDVIIRRKRAKKKMGSIVDDIMTRDPITVKEEETLQHAIEVMGMNKIKRLIIVDDQNRVKGVISRPDLVRLFLMKG